MGKKEQSLRAFQDALRLDPSLTTAEHNMELLEN
jgi:hypothetical protein